VRPPTLKNGPLATSAWCKSDVKLKHRNMAKAAFPFFRATFYRWAQWWPLICPHLARAPQVPPPSGICTWKILAPGGDFEGRLIWGVNDFDEAWPASYAVDPGSPGASCYLAIQEEHLSITRKKACRAIEQGYRDSLAKGGAPFVLAEHHRWRGLWPSTSSAIRFSSGKKSAAARATKESFPGRSETPTRVHCR